MKNIKIRNMALAIICVVLFVSTNVFAATVTIGSNATANFTNAQFYVLGSSNVTTYTSSAGTTVAGSIYPGDLCTVLNATGTYWQVSYPTSSGSKIAYCNKANILSNTSYSKIISIDANSTVYRKSDMSTSFGTVFTTDTIYMLSPIANGKAQIIYNISGGYKIGWIYATVASSVDFTNEKKKFPNGKYWNHPTNSTNAPNSYTSYPCGSTGYCQKHGGNHTNSDLSTGACGCNSFGGAIQCMGFARKVGTDLFGSSPTSWTQKTSTSDVDNLRPGDYVRFKYDGHSVIVTSKDSNNIYVVECNADGQCGIDWNGSYSISYVKNTLTEIRLHP